MAIVTRRIAPGYAERYHPPRMKRVLGLFVYHPEKTCPLCGSSHVHRTKRGRVLEFWILLFFPFRPYRCGKCRQRFYGPKKFARKENPDEPHEANEPNEVVEVSASDSRFQSSRR
jgi:ribosomal protein L37AE/L43A